MKGLCGGEDSSQFPLIRLFQLLNGNPQMLRISIWIAASTSRLSNQPEAEANQTHPLRRAFQYGRPHGVYRVVQNFGGVELYRRLEERVLVPARGVRAAYARLRAFSPR
jgi:hypothetical protein